MTPDALRERLAMYPTLPFVAAPSLVEPLDRLGVHLRSGARLWIKRDDAIAFGFGGNKVRKLAFVAAEAQAAGATTLITAGGIQSNHARVTAAAAAKLGLGAILVANGTPPAKPSANALLDHLLGAEVVYVAARTDRASKMDEIADRVRAEGGHPYVIPIGASTPLGALGFVRAVAELVDQMPVPDVIVHATSSGGTQAGLVAGCRLLGLPTRVIGISADEIASALEQQIDAITRGITPLLSLEADALARGTAIEVDDRFVGAGYGISTDASREAMEIAARTEAVFLDSTYTAKAMAGLIAYVRDGRFADVRSVLFWHTGGQVGLFA